jgi:hypothetical protein
MKIQERSPETKLFSESRLPPLKAVQNKLPM